MRRAILRSYESETKFSEDWCLVADDHSFANGPYQDTVPFAVGSNQAVLQPAGARVHPATIAYKLVPKVFPPGEHELEDDPVWWSAHQATIYLLEHMGRVIRLLGETPAGRQFLSKGETRMWIEKD